MANQIVIGAGFGRTGTLSTRAALEHLGVGPTYHMVENFNKGHWNEWSAMEESSAEERSKLLHTVLKGYQSSVDFPSCMFFEDLLRINPKAKVLLTIRDTPEAWVKSAKETVLMIPCGTYSAVTNYPIMDTLSKTLWWAPLTRLQHLESKMLHVMFLKKEEQKFTDDNLVRVYNNWIAHVKKTVPAHQLLIFNVKQGWEPLCKFLNFPVPDIPFPRVNDAKSLKPKLILMDFMTVLTTVAIYGGLAACIHGWLFNNPDQIKMALIFAFIGTMIPILVVNAITMMMGKKK